MTQKPQDTEPGNSEQMVAQIRRDREKTYREQALKLFPSVCARCGREFSGKRLRELTVHHKDHNHDNNPPDGRNWELCHDNEHSRLTDAEWSDGDSPGEDRASPGRASSTFKPFAALEALLKDKK